jgi:streptogramin lyase
LARLAPDLRRCHIRAGKTRDAWYGGGMRGWRGGVGVVLVACEVACGDSGGRDDSGVQTATLPATEPATSTVPTTSATASVSATDSDAGSQSASESQTTPADTTDAPTDPTASTGPVTVTQTDPTPGTTITTLDPDTGTASTTEGTTGDPCQGGGMGFDFSYLWVANTDQGSISKINTMTLLEEARYYADPTQSGAASTSRTSVNIDGHFVVVSNRGTGWVTKVAASEPDCVDKNGNGTIETSPNKDTLLPWGEDECVLWSTQVTANVFSVGAGPRATAWAPGTFNPQTCAFENQKVWIGWLTAPGQAVMARLDGTTGAIEGMAPLPNWPISIDAPNAYAPYGAAADAQGFIWTTAVFSNVVYRIHPDTFEVTMWSSPDADSHYGMTVDNKGRVWFANWQGHGGVSYFDANTQAWTVIPNSGNNIYRGIAVDSEDQVWVASDAGGTNGCGMMQVDGVNNSVVLFHTFQQCSTPLGMSIDVDGDVWLVDHDGWAWEIDPLTYQKTQVPIANSHYTYSDMTGGGLKNAITPG